MDLQITVENIRLELERRKYNKIDTYFPDHGPLRRELYVKHLEFFSAGLKHRERTAMAANRVGKTEGMGGYEVVLHATGNYPDWWEGKRFDKPVKVLAAGETNTLVRDSLQKKLLGPIHDRGTGIIPRHALVDITRKSGIKDAVDIIYVRHASGGISEIQLMSYDQGREAFQATERDIIWLDEEPPLDIYAECLIRTTTTNGIVISTFTPLKGMSETVLSLREKEEKGIGIIITATWDDVPHLTEDQKTELFASLPPHQRDARTKGVPTLGAGAIYPVSEDDIFIPDFAIPAHFKKAYGMDVGWNNTAAALGAYDADNDILYITNDYKRGQAEPPSHAEAIKLWGDWIKGAIDPASRGRSQKDGTQLMQEYIDLGLILVAADNTVEAGIFDVYNRMVTGRLKIFNSCVKTRAEFRLYRRDEKGKIVKDNDHIMDCIRYLVRTGIAIADVKRQNDDFKGPGYYSRNYHGAYT